MPMLGVMRETLDEDEESMSGEEDFFSVASTMPLAALMPSEVTPWLTALSAYSAGVSVFMGRQFKGWIGATYLNELAAGRKGGEGEGVSVGHVSLLKLRGGRLMESGRYSRFGLRHERLSRSWLQFDADMSSGKRAARK